MERIIISKLYDILLYKSHNNILLYGNGDKLNILDNLFYRLYDIKIVKDNKLLEKTDIYYYINCNRKVTYDDIYNYTLSLNYYKKNILYLFYTNIIMYYKQVCAWHKFVFQTVIYFYIEKSIIPVTLHRELFLTFYDLICMF